MNVKARINFYELVKQSGGILLGSLIYGVGLSWFLLPYKVAPLPVLCLVISILLSGVILHYFSLQNLLI